MLFDSLLESSRRRESRCRWATVFSFGAQSACVLVLVLAPLFYTGALPPLRFGEHVGVPPPPVSRPRPTVELVGPPSNLLNAEPLRAPRFIPAGVYVPREPEVAAPAVSFGDQSIRGVPGGTGDPGESSQRILAGLLRQTVVPLPSHALPRQPLQSDVVEGLLIYRTQPEYPYLARIAHVQGTVQLRAIIDKEGRVEQLHVVSGHPLLVEAALDAVRRWRYRPYRLNGQPVEVEAQITVNFRLDG